MKIVVCFLLIVNYTVLAFKNAPSSRRSVVQTPAASPQRAPWSVLFHSNSNSAETSFTNNKNHENESSSKITSDTIVAANAPPPPTAATALQLNAFDLCLCGAFATAFGDFVMHPIDTIKITQQTAVVAKSMFATCTTIIATKGLAGLYQGVVPYLLSDGISGAVKFATFEVTRRFSEETLPEKYHSLLRFLCAAFAMLVCSVFLVPGEVIKTRLQAGSSAGNTVTMIIQQILQVSGWWGLFAGYFATLVRDIPYTMLELGIYENMKLLLAKLRLQNTNNDTNNSNDNGGTNNAKEELIAAAVTGAIAAFFTTPLDLVKTRLMMATSTTSVSVGHVLVQLYAENGWASLFVGALARITWLVPFTVIYLGVYERCKRWLLHWKQERSNKQ